MIRRSTPALLAAAAMASFSVASQAQVFEVFSEAEAANGDSSLTFLETVAVDASGTAYAFLRDTSATDLGGVNAFDGISFTTISTPADWAATGSSFDIAAGNGVAIIPGDVARFVSFFDNNVYNMDLTTGAVTEFVSKATIDAAAGFGVSVNLTAVNEVTADGTIYMIDSVSDQLLKVDTAGNVTVEIDTADLDALLGGTSIGGIGVSGDTIYLGSNSDDQLVAWDTVSKTGSVVLTTAEIEAVTDDIDGRAGFGDIFAAPNGLVYFYESDSDYLLAFGASNPAGSIVSIISEAEFTAGPSSDTINQLAWYDGNIAFTDGSIGFYTIPAPTGALAGLAGLTLLVTRRRR